MSNESPRNVTHLIALEQQQQLQSKSIYSNGDCSKVDIYSAFPGDYDSSRLEAILSARKEQQLNQQQPLLSWFCGVNNNHNHSNNLNIIGKLKIPALMADSKGANLRPRRSVMTSTPNIKQLTTTANAGVLQKSPSYPPNINSIPIASVFITSADCTSTSKIKTSHQDRRPLVNATHQLNHKSRRTSHSTQQPHQDMMTKNGRQRHGDGPSLISINSKGRSMTEGRDDDGDDAVLSPPKLQTTRRSRAIAIRRHQNNAFQNDDHDPPASVTTERMYDWATWRMYHRITDHRRRHPIKSPYPDGQQRPQCASANDDEDSSDHHDDYAGGNDFRNDRRRPLTPVEHEHFFDGEIFELEI